jgi:hypothetical protein
MTTQPELRPAVLDTLALLCQGRAIIEVSHDGECGYLDILDGKAVRDPDHPDRKLVMPGVWTLYRGGYVDRFGAPTEAGRLLNDQRRRGP